MSDQTLALRPLSPSLRRSVADGRGGRETVLVVAAAYDVLALCLATGLSVFRPRRRARR
jgi:hypothetical protein